jgi:glucose-6-phosphate 1-epimerase
LEIGAGVSIVAAMNEPLPLDQLQGHFEIPGVVEIAAGRGGLPRASIRTDLGEAEIYLLGAHVTHFQPRGQRPVLFMSKRSFFQDGQPIRGGVPVIFPWFGARQDDASAPMHGFVRLMHWGVESVEQQAGGEVSITFALTADEPTRRMWDGDFVLQYRVTVGRRLEMALQVRNAGETGFRFEEALHTYFLVGDIRNVRVLGLENTQFRDKTRGFDLLPQGPEPITFTAETDRVYQDTQATCVIDDPGHRRRINVIKHGSDTTVVWNPWSDKARLLPDFDDDEWQHMLCVETVNARERAIDLPPGQEHEMRAIIEVVSA